MADEGPGRSRAARCGQGESVMHFPRLIVMARDLMLAAWAVGILAFCVLGIAGAMR